jgi:TolB-like protein
MSWVSRLEALWSELNRRNVIRVAGAYLAISWLIVQIVQAVLPAFGFSPEATRVVIILLAIGFLPALIFAWVFEITPGGLKLEHEVAPGQSITKSTGRNLERIIIVALVAALTFFLIDRFLLEPGRTGAAVETAFQEGQSKALLESYGDRSIAVLPFVNMSGDPEQEYFSDGVSEELLNLLARVPQLRVISRSSSFAFKGQTIGIPEIARQLRVAHVLEGSVRKAGDKVRITVQLIEARTDAHLWSVTYDRTLDDIFAVQDEIATEVVHRLKVTLVEGAPRSRVTNTEAYTLYLQAKALFQHGSEESISKAIDLLKQAVTIDPNFVDGWNELAAVFHSQAAQGLRPFGETMASAEDALAHARAIDPHDPKASCRLAGIKTDRDRDFVAASRLIQDGLKANATEVSCLAQLGALRETAGQLDGAIEISNYLTDRDPLGSHYVNLAVQYWSAGRWDAALSAIEHERLLTPDLVALNAFEGVVRVFRGQSGDAEAALAIVEREAIEGWRLHGLVMVHYKLGNRAASDVALAEFIAKHAKGWPFNIAAVSAYRGERDQAFAWLNRAIEFGDSGLRTAAVDPHFIALRRDPRWLPFLEKVGQHPDQLARLELDFKLPESP